MKITYNEHLNPRPYRMAAHVKFHIQKRSDVDGVALCGGIYPSDRYAVFSAEFVSRFDSENQCQCCMKEHQDFLKIKAAHVPETEAEKADRLENYEIWGSMMSPRPN